jgi:hypothetical protein
MSVFHDDDFEITYNGNRFAYFGNGWTRTELDQTADWAYYIRNEDDAPFSSLGKRRRVLTRAGTLEGGGLGEKVEYFKAK